MFTDRSLPGQILRDQSETATLKEKKGATSIRGRFFRTSFESDVLSPHLTLLDMPGYTANVIAHHNVLDEGVHFIPKQFTTKELATKVREVLANNTPFDRFPTESLHSDADRSEIIN